LEIQISKYKTSAEESKRNYDYLLNNYKSAEKLSYFQNKVSQLSEEKAVILQTNAEAIKNLSNEINELNIQLNEYKRKELEHIKVNQNIIVDIDKSTAVIKKELNNSTKENLNLNKAELFFEKELNKEKKEIGEDKSIKKNPFDNEEKEIIQSPSENKEERNISNTKENSYSLPNENTPNKSQKNQGFFSRFIAPIFLTENELNNLSQD